MAKDLELKKHLLRLLRGRGAHVDFDTAIAEVSPKYYGKTFEGLPYTLWQLLEHIRLAQEDILEYLQNPDYKEKPWPEAYWPDTKDPPTKTSWKKSVASYKKDFHKIEEMLEDPNLDLFAQVPHIKGKQNILKGLLLVADHTVYHLGQMVLLMKLLGAWKK